MFEYPANGSGRDAVADPGAGGAITYSDTLECFFIPPTTNDYVFFATGADLNDVYLSTDTDPANMVNIAQVNGWTNARDWGVDQCGTSNGIARTGTRQICFRVPATRLWAWLRFTSMGARNIICGVPSSRHLVRRG